jgi:hypothetical protein
MLAAGQRARVIRSDTADFPAGYARIEAGRRLRKNIPHLSKHRTETLGQEGFIMVMRLIKKYEHGCSVTKPNTSSSKTEVSMNFTGG